MWLFSSMRALMLLQLAFIKTFVAASYADVLLVSGMKQLVLL